MKILIINTSPFTMNGITKVITNYYIHMDKRNINLDLVVINEASDTLKKPFMDGGSCIYVLKRREDPVLYFRKLVKILKEGNYDAVHVHGNSALMAIDLVAAYFASIKKRIVHSHSTSCEHAVMNKLLWPLFMVLTTDRLACGKMAGEWLYKSKKYILFKNSFLVLKNGIDLDLFRFYNDVRTEYRKKLELNKELLIGHVGHFNNSKNHSYIIDLFETLLEKRDDCKLLLIGDGPNRNKIVEEIKEKGLTDKITIIPATLEVNCYMSAMDVLILPSLFEGLPVVSIEAQAMDLPCVFSDVISTECDITGSIKFLPLQDKSGWTDVVLTASKKVRNSDAAIKKLTDAGYNIKINASVLRGVYLDKY